MLGASVIRFTILALFFTLVLSNATTVLKPVHVSGSYSQSFAHLLNNLINRSKNRLNAAKKLYGLNSGAVDHSYLPKPEHYLRTTDIKVILILTRKQKQLLFGDKQLKTIRINTSGDDSQYSNPTLPWKNHEPRSSDYEVSGALRSSSACRRHNARTCKEACRSALKRVCHIYSCRSSFKHDMKKECKSKCKEIFDYDE